MAPASPGAERPYSLVSTRDELVLIFADLNRLQAMLMVRRCKLTIIESHMDALVARPVYA